MSRFRQSRLGYRLGFELGDEGFVYTVTDGGMKRVFTIGYDRFDMSASAFERVQATRPGMILFFLCAMSISLALGYGNIPAIMRGMIGFAGLFGFLLILWRTTGLFAVPFTVFGDEHGGEAFRVMCDNQHDQIVEAIEERQKIRRLLLEVPEGSAGVPRLH